MSSNHRKLMPGDLVEIMSPREILATLDQDGTVGRLPFMPEMAEFCGRQFRVAKRVVKTCYYIAQGGSGMRKFPDGDVVVLENVRCSGAAHDGCQKGCLIFWRESWLRKVGEGAAQATNDSTGREELRARLKTTTGPGRYFCQSSEILNSTQLLNRWERFGKCYSEIKAQNCGPLEMTQRIGVWVFWKARRALLGPYGRGNGGSKPASLQLRPGDSVAVKSMAQITETLDSSAHNRGLYFTPAMRKACGKNHQVERKLERIIVDGTGEMRKLNNTVYLEGSMCGCSCVAFGGCPRNEFAYWREAWLERA